MISGRPNLLYVLDTLVYELNQIQEDNGYFTNVKQVIQPDFPPYDTDRCLGVGDTPALLVWLLGQGQGRTPNTLQNVFINARIEIMGVVKAKEGVQYLAAGLCEDVRRVLLSNGTRVHPMNASAPPFAGVATYEDARGTDFEINNLEESVTLCRFGSTWNVEYNFPIQSG